MPKQIKVMTLNANGLRSLQRKDFFSWFLAQDVDVLCLQEIKAQADQLSQDLFELKGYTRHLLSAQKPGYSGVAIYCRLPVLEVLHPLEGLWIDEGRLLGLRLSELTVYSLYLPSGTQGDVRQKIKYQLMDELWAWMQLNNSKPMVIAGDWNIAHQQIDLKNWRSNQKNSGFLPPERDWLTQVFDKGWVDTFRHQYPEKEQYTWWTYRANARANNVGWRIDYQVCTKDLAPTLMDGFVDAEPLFSDHAPYTVIYQL